MNTLQVISIVISCVCVVICTVLAWVTLNKVSRTEVSFAGTPTDKKEFQGHCAENARTHDQLFAKISGAERGVEARMMARLEKSESDALASRRLMHSDLAKVSQDVAGVKAELQGNTNLCIRLDGKIDRLIERGHS